jgi:hypothetical protein
MSAVVQEFYCNDCDGYFRARLSLGFNRCIRMVCPNCGRKHPRVVKNGMIRETGHVNNPKEEEVYVPKTSYSKTPVTRAMARAQSVLARPHPPANDLKAVAAYLKAYEQTREGAQVPENRQIIQEAWNDRYTDRHEQEQ